VARSTGNKNYDVRVVGVSAEVRMALARAWANAVMRKSAAIQSPDGSDKPQSLFESEGGLAPCVAGSRKVQGVQKTHRIRKAGKTAP